MRRVIIFSTAAIVAVTLASVGLYAQRPGGPGPGRGEGRPAVQADGQGTPDGAPRGPGRFGGRFGGPVAGVALRGLDLTDEQRTQVQSIVRERRDTSGPLADELRLTQRNLQRAVFAESGDAAAVSELSAKVSQLREQLADIRVETSTAIAEVLTPEQREILRARMGQGRGAMRGGPGRGFGRGFGRGPVGIS